MKEARELYDIGNTNYAVKYDFSDPRVRYFIGDCYRSRERLNALGKNQTYDENFDSSFISWQMGSLIKAMDYMTTVGNNPNDVNHGMARMFTYSPELQASNKYLKAYLDNEPEPTIETVEDSVVYHKYGVSNATQYMNLMSMVKVKTKSGEDAYELKFDKNLQRNFDSYKEIDTAEYDPIYVNQDAGRKIIDKMVSDVLHVEDKDLRNKLVDNLNTGNTPSDNMVYNIGSLEWYQQNTTKIDTMKVRFDNWSWVGNDDKYMKWADGRKKDAEINRNAHKIVGVQGAVMSDKKGQHIDINSMDMSQATIDDEADRYMGYQISEAEQVWDYADKYVQRLRDEEANYKRGHSVWNKIPHPHIKKYFKKSNEDDLDL